MSSMLLRGLPWKLRWYRVCLQCGRPGFNPWVRKIPWRRKWQPTAVLFVWKIPWTEEPGGLQSTGSQRVWVISLSHATEKEQGAITDSSSKNEVAGPKQTQCSVVMCLVVKVKSDAVKNNIAQKPGMLGPC